MLRFLSPSRSLSTKLTLFSLGSVLLPMLVLTIVNNTIATETVVNIAHDRLRTQASGAIEQIELHFKERQADTKVFASLDVVWELLEQQTSTPDTTDVGRVLTTARETYQYSAISVLNKEGKVVYSTASHLLGQDYSSHKEVQEALQGRSGISDFAADPGEDLPVLHFTAPIYNRQGLIVGVVDSRSTLEKLDSILAFDTNRTGEGSWSTVIDEHLIRLSVPAHKNTLLYRPGVPLPAQEVQQIIEKKRFGDQTATFMQQANNLTEYKRAIEEVRLSGQEEIFFRSANPTSPMNEAIVKRLRTKPWYYVHWVPVTSFNAPVSTQTRYALTLTVLACLVSVGSMVIFARRVLNRPLSQLVDMASSITSGNLRRRLHLHRGDEIGVLASSFNSMAESLEERITAEQQSRGEAERLQQQERESRERLEQTVTEYLNFTQQVAQGDLSQRLSIQHQDALGQLGSGLNNMVGSLRSITGEVQQASSNIAAAAAEILAATTQQSANASEQSTALSQTSTTIEEVRTIAQQTAQQANQVAKDSQSALFVARQGAQAVEQTVSGMIQIRDRVEGIAQTILSLSEQTQAISEIITTVNDLADQSNLLALNAAIEAARAGEQGKSFAVVAQHVRDLAERSKDATRQVREILGEIQRGTNTAVLVTEEGTKGVEAGSKLAGEAGNVIHRIASEVESGAQSNTQMAAAAQQQMAGMDQIGQAMNSIQQATAQTLASTRQAERAARDLHSLAQSLQKATAAYRI